MDRVRRSEETYRRLFGARPGSASADDPEFWEILQRLVFGEVFYIGDLDDRTRELITITVLATQQCLPQLTAHVGAGLNVGLDPVEIREAVYQLASFVGYPKTLNAVGAMNEAFTARGIELPLPAQGTVTEQDRFERGKAIQSPLYGGEIAELLADLPEGLREALPYFLTSSGFGDFYTRGGLDVATRELLVLCMFAAMGDVPNQLKAHTLGNFRAGNSREKVLAAMIHCYPYIGFPRTLNAVRIIKELRPE